MSTALEIRSSGPADVPSIEALYRDAFPGEDLLPLVADLLGQPSGVTSLVARSESVIVGHVMGTMCRVAGCCAAVALLGPLAVAPAVQGRGIGGTLVRETLWDLTARGAALALVLGDPRYYARFGFVLEVGIIPPYPLVAEWRTAWQSIPLGAADHPCGGRLEVPEPWRRPALWSP